MGGSLNLDVPSRPQVAQCMQVHAHSWFGRRCSCTFPQEQLRNVSLKSLISVSFCWQGPLRALRSSLAAGRECAACPHAVERHCHPPLLGGREGEERVADQEDDAADDKPVGRPFFEHCLTGGAHAGQRQGACCRRPVWRSGRKAGDRVEMLLLLPPASNAPV